MFKVNNKDISERRSWRRSGVFIVNFEHISHLVLVFLLLILSRQMPYGLRAIMMFKQKHAGQKDQ